MGSNSSQEEQRMSSSDSEPSEPNLLFRSAGGDTDDESDLPSLVAYLIRSGQIRFISSNNEDSDDSDPTFDSDDMTLPRPAMLDPVPDIKKLKESDIYNAVMQSSGRWSDRQWTFRFKPSIPNMVIKRELGMNRQQQFSNGEKVVLNSKYLPNKMKKLASYHHKAFCGTYSQDGNVFLSACQDQNIRVYSTIDDNFELMKCIRARDVGWSVLDTAFSPDGRFAAYSSWSDCIHLCNIYGDHEVHEALHLHPGDHSFCIFSLVFSSDNKEILGGANDGHLYVYDRHANKRTLKIKAHDDDVNTVKFADGSSQILYSGGDDGLCKVWDRRTLSEQHPLPVGTMSGHCDGITYIDSKGDARFFISNSKDQTLKLWDVRNFASERGIEETKKVVSAQRWDYRWQQVPKKVARRKELKGDSSIMTYSGPCILHTLIRCKFSPDFTTGQRYIYTGCASGSLFVFDLLTGHVVRRLEGHSSCVRDVSWHPYKNTIISTSWDGTLGQWCYSDSNADDWEEKVEKTCSHRRTRQGSGSKRVRVKGIKETNFPGLFD